ncbi:MAG: hypothetical protein LRY55_01750 [Leadbetterella sp.]|nr:hypothetical protein [Leadbetterella sp.]
MNKTLILLLLLVLPLVSAAQETADTLTVKRRVFTSTVYRKGIRQNNQMLFSLYAKSKAYDAEKQLKQSRIMIPAGAGVTAAGFALGISALIGTKETALVDNVEYTYYKRPVVNVLGGIGLIAAGICLMESGNDKRVLSIDRYNKKKKHDILNPGISMNERGHLGLKWSF